MIPKLAADKPTIKILIYTDDPLISPTTDSSKFLGLGSMLELMQQHAPAFARLETKLVNRHTAGHADNKINDVLLKEVDEIWFFGTHQANAKTRSLGPFRAGPNSELDAAEVAALQKWMSTEEGFQGGGILMTGDHANARPPKLTPTPDSPCGDTSVGAEFLGLGRAIGRCVPRAGMLRRWEGPPTRIDRLSTIGAGSQLDNMPQHLDLQNVNLDGDPDSNGQPHPLFFYTPGKFIRSFPDHAHEGRVILPEAFDAAVWPSGPRGQPQPRVVAFGRDTRIAEPLKIIATYNGDLAGVGRIVADSSWHHYMNLNLRGFLLPEPMNTVLDRIGQFYANLAIWLAPRSKRSQMARAMCWELAQYTLLLEERSDSKSMGDLANSVLLRAVSPCEIHELLQVLPPKEHGGLPAAETAGDSDQPPRELFLGEVLNAYQDVMVRAELVDQADADGLEITSVDELIELAFRRTFDEQENRLRRKLEAVTTPKK